MKCFPKAVLLTLLLLMLPMPALADDGTLISIGDESNYNAKTKIVEIYVNTVAVGCDNETNCESISYGKIEYNPDALEFVATDAIITSNVDGIIDFKMYFSNAEYYTKSGNTIFSFKVKDSSLESTNIYLKESDLVNVENEIDGADCFWIGCLAGNGEYTVNLGSSEIATSDEKEAIVSTKTDIKLKDYLLYTLLVMTILLFITIIIKALIRKKTQKNI